MNTQGSKDNHSALLIVFKSGEGYESKDQFIAGPFRPFQNDKKFVEAYLAVRALCSFACSSRSPDATSGTSGTWLRMRRSTGTRARS